MAEQNIIDCSSTAQRDEDDDVGKLFVGGISSDTTEESLKAYMEKHGGEVESVELKYDKVTQRMRGFGFVKFREDASAEKMANQILQGGPHVVDGKKVDPKRAEKQVKQLGAIRTKKIFVGGLKQEITEKVLQEYFSQFGEVVQIQFIPEKGTEKRRGFCFVEFDNEDVVDQLVKKQYHTIASKTVEVKHAYSKEQQAQLAAKGLWVPGGRGRGRGSYGMGMPGSYGMYDQSMGYGGMDAYGYAGYGSGAMMGYGGAVGAYGGGVTYPTIDYSGWSGRGTENWYHFMAEQREGRDGQLPCG
eukprot:gene8569-14572_t